MNLESYRREEKYADLFDEGIVEPIDGFLASQGLPLTDFTDLDHKIRFVEQAGMFTSASWLLLLVWPYGGQYSRGPAILVLIVSYDKSAAHSHSKLSSS